MHACMHEQNYYINYNDLPRTHDAHLGIKKKIYLLRTVQSILIHIMHFRFNSNYLRQFEPSIGGKPIN